MVQNSPEWPKWPKMAKNGPNDSTWPKWPKMAQKCPNGPECLIWSRLAQNSQNGPKWPKRVFRPYLLESSERNFFWGHPVVKPHSLASCWKTFQYNKIMHACNLQNFGANRAGVLVIFMLLLKEILRLSPESKHSYFLSIYSSHLGRLRKKVWEVDRQNSFPRLHHSFKLWLLFCNSLGKSLKLFCIFIPHATWPKKRKEIPITYGQLEKILASILQRVEGSRLSGRRSRRLSIIFPSVNPLQKWRELLSESFWKSTGWRGWMFQGRPCAALVETRRTRPRCFASTTSSTWARRPRSCIGRWLSSSPRENLYSMKLWPNLPVSTSQRAFHDVLYNQEDNALHEMF